MCRVPRDLSRVLVSKKERGPRETSEASRSNMPWRINSNENQGSGLSLFLFIVILHVISEEFRCGLPYELLFADDLAIVTDKEEEWQRSWLGWQIGMERKGLKLNSGKTEVMGSSRRGTKANVKDSQGTSLRQVKKVKYVGVTIS